MLPKFKNYLAFQYFDFERTWWNLLQNDVLRIKFDIYGVLYMGSHQFYGGIFVLCLVPSVAFVLFPLLPVSCSQCCLCLVPSVACVLFPVLPVSCSQCCLYLVPTVACVLFPVLPVSCSQCCLCLWTVHFWDWGWFRFMVFNATFNNISVISWRSVLLVVEIGVPGENYWPVVSHRQTLSHNVVLSTPRHQRKFNFHAIRTTIAMSIIDHHFGSLLYKRRYQI